MGWDTETLPVIDTPASRNEMILLLQHNMSFMIGKLNLLSKRNHIKFKLNIKKVYKILHGSILN